MAGTPVKKKVGSATAVVDTAGMDPEMKRTMMEMRGAAASATPEAESPFTGISAAAKRIADQIGKLVGGIHHQTPTEKPHKERVQYGPNE